MKASGNWSSSDDSSSSDGEESARIKEVVEESLGSIKGNINQSWPLGILSGLQG